MTGEGGRPHVLVVHEQTEGPSASGTLRERLERELSECERQLALIRERACEAQRLEAVGQLAAGVTHDFSNLLTVIVGMSRMLEPMLAGQPRALSLLSDIQQAGSRAAELVSRLVSFARQRPVQASVVDVNAEIGNFAPLLARVLGAQVEFVVELCAEQDHVWIDPLHLGQLLLNLAVNARDAMPEGGRFWLRTGAALPPKPATIQPWVRIEAKDTGCGMSEDVLARVFEPFFTTKEFGRGTGLGLSIVHGLVTQAGGEIYVRSTPGEGSTFTIWLPIHDDSRGSWREQVEDRCARPVNGPGEGPNSNRAQGED